jgi:hypothetical protein
MFKNGACLCLKFRSTNFPQFMTPAERLESGIRCAGACRLTDIQPSTIDWLRRDLAQRQSPVQQIRQAAEAPGIAWGTLRRAFRDLGAEASK